VTDPLALGPVNPNLVAYPLTAKERRTVGLIERLTILDHDHAVEFARLFAWDIGRYPGGAEGLIRKRFPSFLKRPPAKGEVVP
jgi:hypothetical protein